MSSTRIKYDKDSTKLENERRTKPSIYMLSEGLHESTGKCAPEKGPRHSVSEITRGNRGERAVLESQLRNTHIPLDRNNDLNTDYKSFESKLEKNSACKNFNETEDEYSRFSHPLSDYRGMSTIKNHIVPYLHINPQNVAIDDDLLRRGLSSRIMVKDTHKIVAPQPINQNKVLPTPNDKAPELPNVTCA